MQTERFNVTKCVVCEKYVKPKEENAVDVITIEGNTAVFCSLECWHKLSESISYKGSLPFTRGDRIHQLKQFRKFGRNNSEIAKSWGTVIEYVNFLSGA